MEIQAAIQGLLSIKTIAEGLVATRDESKVAEVRLTLFKQVIEIQQVLMSLQQEVLTLQKATFALLQENHALKEQAHELQNRKAQLQGYELFEPIPGVFVYAAKAIADMRPQPPYLCQACYDKSEKSTLTFQRATSRLEPTTLQCPANARHALQLQRGITMEMLASGRLV